MTIDVTCLCGGRFAAPPHLAGKSVRCPQCQQTLQVPAPPREPLAPLINPFSDAAAPVEAELVAPTMPPAPVQPPSQDPFGGKATVGSSVGQPQPAPYVAATYADPQGYSQPQPGQPSHGYAVPQKKSHAMYYVIGAVLFGVVGFVFVAGLGVYQVLQELNNIAFDDFSTPLPVQAEDYQAARSKFHTTLTVEGEAPQDWDPLETPQGAVDLPYESGGLSLLAFVDPPPADGQPRPGVVFLHGGFAWGEGDWEMSQPYRDQGYVVMSPVLRGENGQPGHFSLYYNEVEDVLAATAAFAELPYVDETQLYICGHSAGGTLASLTAMTTDRFLALASFSGSMNQDGLGDWDPDLVVYDEYDEQEMLMRSPEAYAKSFKCPAQLYYGHEEEWFPDETSRTVATARSAGLNVRAMPVPGDHMSSVEPAILRSIQFFRSIGPAGGRVSSSVRNAMPQLTDPPGRPEPLLPDVSLPDPPQAPTAAARAPPSARGDAPEFGIPPPRVPRPVTPPRPDFSIPNVPAPPTPRAGRPGFPKSTRPPLPAAPPGFHQGVVTFEVLDYTGRVPQRFSARQALIRNPWADTARIEIDEDAGWIKVPARKHLPVDTDKAKQSLEAQGYTIGTATFRSTDASDSPQPVASDAEE